MPLGVNVHAGARMLRSAAFRLAVIQALLFALIALTLFLVSWFAARHYIENQLRQTITDEFSEVVAHPPAQRAASIHRSLAQVPRGVYDYSLFDAHRSYYRRLFADPAAEAGRRIWGFKEVRLTMDHAAYFRALYPKCKIILLYRHPFSISSPPLSIVFASPSFLSPPLSLLSLSSRY